MLRYDVHMEDEDENAIEDVYEIKYLVFLSYILK